MNKNLWRLSLAAALILCVPHVSAQPRGATSSLDPNNLRVASVHAAVADLDSGAVVYRKNASRVVPIASLTKLMTAMVVLDLGQPLDEWLTIVERDEEPPNNGWSRMRVGSELTRGELLRLTLMASENHAAYVLAQHHPGGLEGFVASMNAKAGVLGLRNTHFVDPSGLSPLNRSTAAEFLALAQAALRYEKIREYTGTRVYKARFRKPRYTLTYGNTNVLIHRGHWDVALSKTGYLDEAGRCLVMVTEVDGRRMAMVLLDSYGRRTPVGDAGRVKRWLTTGESGAVARAARRYERRATAALQKSVSAAPAGAR